MKKLITYFVFILLAGYPVKKVNGQNVPLFTINQKTDAKIKSCINEINADSIKSYMQSLEDMETRWTYASNRKEVAQWIAYKFKSFGYTNVQLQTFNHLTEVTYNSYSEQYNVTCIYPGTTSTQIVIGAHHDAVQVSPGADDNASGTAGVLELARVIKKLGLETQHTFKFITFAAEEIGLVGSNYSAQESLFLGDSIALMLNMDMISNSSSDSLNLIGINHKVYDHNLGVLAQFMGINYTGMTTEYFGYPTNSDHHSYGKQGIPVIYFEEYEFSDVYHTKNDLVVNTNSIYASCVVKTLAATSLAFDALPQLSKPIIVQSGNGEQVTMHWENKPTDNYYQVYIDLQNSGYQLIKETDKHSITLSDLTPLNEYPVLIKVWNFDGNANGFQFTLLPDSVPSIPINITVSGLAEHIQINWNKNTDEDIAGYQVYEAKNGLSIKKNNAVLTDSFFNDYSITDTLYHYYKVSAVDKQGYEGPLSLLQSTKLGKDSYLEDSIELLVILDLSAAPILQNEMKSYFEELLINQSHQTILLTNSNPLSPNIIYFSKKIIWCSPAMNANSSAFVSNFDALTNYLLKGGKLMLSVTDPNIATAGFKRTMPSLIPENHPSKTFLQAERIDLIPNSYFTGLETMKAGYPALSINWESVPSQFLTDNYLNFVQAIESISDNNEIYSYQAPNPADNIHGRMHGMPVGIEHIGSDFDLVFLSIPISFMNQEKAAQLINYVIDEKFSNNTNEIPELKHISDQELIIWPNPAQKEFTIKTNAQGLIRISNELGQIIYTTFLLEENNQKLVDVSQWSKGLYVVTYQNYHSIRTQKLIIH
ncbi:MAG: M20/M25/M40 family metallo-hydrolase [Salinivirgaceae bacterium]